LRGLGAVVRVGRERGEGRRTRGIPFLRIFCLRFFDGAVVVYEDECVLVFRVHIALCALVAGAEVALVWSERYLSWREVPTEGSYSGSEILEGDSCWPL